LNHDDSNVRWKIARQLGHLKNKIAVLPLIDTLKDSDSIVRNNAIWSLGEIGDRRALVL
jgi:HEAT repeat protein